MPTRDSRRVDPIRAAAPGPLATLLALAISASASAGTLPDGGELSCLRAATGECNYRDPHSGLTLRWPNDWPVRRLKLVTETGPIARSRQRDALRWVSVEYLPDDPNLPETSLLRIAVLRFSDWLAQSAQPLPAAAVEVATGRNLVAVASIAGANPYPPGSRDADIFEALQPDHAEISLIVGFPGQ